MNVRCLRSHGAIENYSSTEPETEELETEEKRMILNADSGMPPES
jgi:hypothetical protein